MAAVFGVIGEVSPAELDEMGRRLAHRGAAATWEEVSPGVYLGQVARAALPVAQIGGTRIVIDAPESSNGYTRVSNALRRSALQRSAGARDLDRALQIPFAFAAWDDALQSLMLGRDFLGLKPLHYCRLRGGGVAFATEYKALLAIDAAT